MLENSFSSEGNKILDTCLFDNKHLLTTKCVDGKREPYATLPVLELEDGFMLSELNKDSELLIHVSS